MKKTLILVFIVLLGCSQDDNSSNSSFETLIIGKWKFIEQGRVIDGQEQPYSSSIFCDTPESFLWFLDDSTYNYRQYLCSNGSVSINNGSGVWQISSNDLFLNTSQHSIITLNSQNLKLYSTYTLSNEIHTVYVALNKVI